MRRAGRTAVGEYDYDLPEERIAQVPIEPRSAARLLVALDPAGPVRHLHVDDLPDLLGPGDVLVVNDTRVLPARLELRKSTGGRVEVLLLAPSGPDEAHWEALVRPGRRVPAGTVLGVEPGGPPVMEVLGSLPAPGAGASAGPEADAGVRTVRILDDGLMSGHGHVPLPPYIHETPQDPERYQTVYARHPGSVAAPTAGLHFTIDLLDRCRRAGATVADIDLAVGLGTFRPITADQVEDHVMHAERYRVPPETLDACRAARRVVAVGTTAARALETVAAGGPLEGSTQLYIHGDYDWKLVDVLLTNFHMPRSSLLVLLASFAGPGWRSLYEEALGAGYRFLSFGDAMLVGRRPQDRPGPLDPAPTQVAGPVPPGQPR